MNRLYILVAFLFLATFSFAQKQTTRPNIIFILADDLGYGDVGCYGQQKIETPNIDRLASKGLKFMQFYSGSTVCAPARTTFLTGLHTGHTPIRGNKSYKPEGQSPLPDSVITFANILQRNGYSTAAFGKWSLGYITTSGDPNKKGFDEFFGYNCQTLAHNYYPDHLWDNHERIDLKENKDGKNIYSADLIHQQALQFIKKNNGNPFFIYLPYTLPHAEVIAPHDSVYYYYINKFKEQPNPEKKIYEGRVLDPYPHACFAAMVSRLDRYVGEIIEAVKEKGFEKNTLIIFTSDNGPHKEGGGDPEFFKSNGPYRGLKRDLYEGGIRVPFIAYWPGKIQPDVTDQVAALWDMYSTLLEIAGIPNKNKTDGLSLAPTFFKKGKQQQHEYLYWEFHENNGSQGLRWKNWKAVELEVGKNPDPVLELYDLKRDPKEQNNIADKFPEIVAKMKVLIKQAHKSIPDWPLLFEELKKNSTK